MQRCGFSRKFNKSVKFINNPRLVHMFSFLKACLLTTNHVNTNHVSLVTVEIIFRQTICMNIKYQRAKHFLYHLQFENLYVTDNRSTNEVIAILTCNETP